MLNVNTLRSINKNIAVAKNQRKLFSTSPVLNTPEDSENNNSSNTNTNTNNNLGNNPNNNTERTGYERIVNLFNVLYTGSTYYFDKPSVTDMQAKRESMIKQYMYSIIGINKGPMGEHLVNNRYTDTGPSNEPVSTTGPGSSETGPSDGSVSGGGVSGGGVSGGGPSNMGPSDPGMGPSTGFRQDSSDIYQTDFDSSDYYDDL